eukprot:scaffold54941_cov72-Cyclotella_meneghiniana.AAC.3
MIELQTSSAQRSSVSSRRKLLVLCAASIALSHQNTIAAFSPSVSGTCSFAPSATFSHETSSTAFYIGPKRNKRRYLALRSSVIQSYRIEDDPNVSSSNAFSFLPSRLSLVQRLETPSQFKSAVMDEHDSLVVVRFSADTCPSCRATIPLFRKWARDNQDATSGLLDASNTFEVKIVEMILNKATSAFIQDKLHVDQIPYCHLYHPQAGLIEEQVVMNKVDFRDFVDVVDKWAAGLNIADYDSCVLCSKDELIDDCEEFC